MNDEADARWIRGVAVGIREAEYGKCRAADELDARRLERLADQMDGIERRDLSLKERLMLAPLTRELTYEALQEIRRFELRARTAEERERYREANERAANERAKRVVDYVPVSASIDPIKPPPQDLDWEGRGKRQVDSMPRAEAERIQRVVVKGGRQVGMLGNYVAMEGGVQPRYVFVDPIPDAKAAAERAREEATGYCGTNLGPDGHTTSQMHAIDKTELQRRTSLWLNRKGGTMEGTPLRSKVRDQVSGIEGIAMGRATYANGCVQVQIEATAKDGERKVDWFDEQRIVVLEREAFKPEPSPARAGGPQAHAAPRDGI